AAPRVSSKVRTALQASPESEGVVCAINMREQFSGLETKRCCEEKTEATCVSCCQEHFASRGDKCVDVCSSMCSFGWNAANQKVPQCPEKLGALAAISSMHDAGILDMLHFASTFVSLST
ncbi:F23F12.8, partial [Symbiodinium pilosum]